MTVYVCQNSLNDTTPKAEFSACNYTSMRKKKKKKGKSNLNPKSDFKEIHF